jgi:hypothetical protein
VTSLRKGDIPMKSWLKPEKSDFIIHVKSEGDIKTLTDARNLIRGLPARDRNRCIRVMVHNDQWLDTPFTLGPEDSGTAKSPIIYQASPGLKPRISGGRKLTGWEESSDGKNRIWKTFLTDVSSGDWNFTQLFVNGRRARRPLLPREGFYMFKAVPNEGVPDWAAFYPGDIKSEWAGREEIEVMVFHYWVDSHLGIRKVDTDKGIVYFDRPAVRTINDEKRRNTSRYRIENVREALNLPGQWYLDRKTGELTYLPLSDEELGSTEIIAPYLSYLVLLEGKGKEKSSWSNPGTRLVEEKIPAGRPQARREMESAAKKDVQNVHLIGLSFCHTEWNYPSDTAGAPQAAYTVPGAVRMRYTRDCSVRLCEISHTGTYAVEIEEGSLDTTITGNHLYDMGAGGVKLCHGSGFSTVSDNIIARGGRRYPSSIGVWIGHSGDNAVVHNLIYDFYYTGISAGWIWGYRPSRCRRNIIEYNHIHTIGQGVLSDMGGIYTLGVSPGTSISNNHIHDVSCYGYGGSGLYPDEGTSFIRYEGNLVHHTDTGSISMNYGKDVLFIRNIFLFARDMQIRWGAPKHFSPMTLEKNVIVWDRGSAVDGNWFSGLPTIEFKGNVWWHLGGSVNFSGYNWKQWQKRGFDRDGMIENPLIVADKEGGYNLRTDSPIKKAGIPFPDLSQMGPRQEVLSSGKNPEAIKTIGACVWTNIESAETTYKNVKYEKRYEAYPDRTPCQVKMKAVFENAGDKTWKGRVRFYTSAGLKKTVETSKEITLAPGRQKELFLSFRVPEGVEEVILRADSKEKGFNGSFLSLGFRPVVYTPTLPENIRAKELQDYLKDAPELPILHTTGELGHFRIGVSGKRIALWARVYDHHIMIENPAYKGSMIDIFGIETPTGDNAGQVADSFGQVFLIPPSVNNTARLTYVYVQDIPDMDISSKLHPDGYEVSVLIPMDILKISVKNGEFAFKAAIYTHIYGISGVVRASLFNERARSDIHAYGIMKVLK